MTHDGWLGGLTDLPEKRATKRMVWTIRILKDNRHFAHVAEELHAALAVACILLRRGIVVEEIDGPDGVKVGLDVIQEFCGSDAETGKWRRARLKFLAR